MPGGKKFKNYVTIKEEKQEVEKINIFQCWLIVSALGHPFIC